MAMRVKIRPPKIRPPKILPRRPEIVVGIPSYNEEENIASVVKTIDIGLRKYFPDKKAMIVNADSGSTDDTKKAFLSTKTKTHKRYLSSPSGKGAALKHLFEHFIGIESAQVLVIFDANEQISSPRWIKNLVTPILNGFDHVFPKYNSHEYDASIVNHFCYPIMRGVFGIDLRQPRVGDTSMSRRAVDRLLNRVWPAPAYKFGIDILAPLSSVMAELRIAQTYLGDRYHDVDIDYLSSHFEDRASTLFEKLEKRRDVWEREIKTRRPPLFFRGSRKSKLGGIKVAYKALSDYARDEFTKSRSAIKKIIEPELYEKISSSFKEGARMRINANDWITIVYKFVKAKGAKPAVKAKALKPLYLARFVTFYRDFLDKSHRDADRAITEQAEEFFRRREELFT